MNIIIRQERIADYQAVFNLIEAAFRSIKESNHDEHFLVQRLRHSDAFVQELSLIAEHNGEIIGHILLTKVGIMNSDIISTSLALAPISVLPAYQNKGVGGMLIKYAHNVARELGYPSVVLLGHPEYYPKFGYVVASKHGIRFPFEVQDEYCMVIELTTKGLEDVYGMVKYAKEFEG